MKERSNKLIKEKEYIERGEVLADIDASMKNDGLGYIAGQIMKRYIKRQPTVDVVEVVRCKDCPCLIKDIVEEETPYGFSNKHDVFGCGRILELTGEWVDVSLDDFCSHGERKE